MMEGEILTSLYHPAPDCTYYMGEQSASGWPHTTFGHVERRRIILTTRRCRSLSSPGDNGASLRGGRRARCPP